MTQYCSIRKVVCYSDSRSRWRRDPLWINLQLLQAFTATVHLRRAGCPRRRTTQKMNSLTLDPLHVGHSRGTDQGHAPSVSLWAVLPTTVMSGLRAHPRLRLAVSHHCLATRALRLARQCTVIEGQDRSPTPNRRSIMTHPVHSRSPGTMWSLYGAYGILQLQMVRFDQISI